MHLKGIFVAAALGAIAMPSMAQAPAPAAQTATPGTLRATPVEPFVFQSATDVKAMTQWPDRKSHSKVVSDHENYFIEYVTRGESGNNPEAHGHWYDYIHVLDGEGTVTYGGSQDGGRDTGNAEIRGGALNGAKTITLHAGDRLVMPPGMPHLFTATKGNTFTYLIFKQRV